MEFLWTLLGALAALCTIFGGFRNLWRARKRRSFYEKQGIRGPPFRFFVGNIPEIQSHYDSVSSESTSFSTPSKLRIIPDQYHFFKTYGKVSVHEVGSLTRLLIGDEELVREVLLSRSSCYRKADIVRDSLRPILGNGVVVSNGEFWKQQRRILNPAFKLSYLKGLTKHMMNAGEELVMRWRLEIDENGVQLIDAHQEMAGLTLDVITRSSFGTTLRHEGQAAFECLDNLLSSAVLSMNNYKRIIPCYSWLPTPENMRLWSKEKYVNQLLKSVIHRRQSQRDENEECDHDLLEMMLEAVSNKSPTMTKAQLLDECKTIFFAGHSTTALTLTWTLIMLSVHQDWQQRARDEVLAALSKSHSSGFLQAEDLVNLEIVEWIINEVLRLYPPLSSLTRQCIQAHTIGNISILPGTLVQLPLLLLLQSEELWGADVFEFNPERFRNKRNSKDMPGFLAFGAGPRMCLGMNFALLEAKLLISLLLRYFTFNLSPEYKHAPGNPLSTKPAFGSPLIVRAYQQ